MTATSNIHIGLTAWATGQTIAVGNRRSNSGNAYQAVAAHTTSGTGPTHTSGTVGNWLWLSAIDYTSLATWAAGIPSTLTQPIVGLLWNDGEITHTANPLLSLSGHATSATNTITLACATGESFVDALAADATKALDYNAAYGVAIRRTGSGNYASVISIADAYVTIKGVQFNDETGYGKTAFNISGANFTFDRCIISGDALGGRFIQITGAGWTVQNCLLSLTTNNGCNQFLYPNSATGSVVNNTFINKGTSTISCWVYVQYANIPCKNNVAFGPASNLMGGNYGVAGTWSYGVSDITTTGSGTSISNSLTGKTAGSQFVSATSNFRLKTGADALDMGTSSGAPAADIIGTPRPQGTGYDAGANELAASAGAALVAAPSAAASATAALSTAIQLAGTSAALASGSAALTTSIRLATAPSGAASATTSLTTGAGLGSTIAAQAQSSASLTTAISLAASPGAAASASGTLTTGIPLASVASTTATAQSALTAGIALVASPAASPVVSAGLATGIVLGTAAAAQSGGTAVLSTGIRLAAAPAAVSTLAAGLTGGAASLAATTAAQPAATATLTTGVPLAAAATAQSLGSASINTGIALAAGAVAQSGLVAGLATTASSLATSPAAQAGVHADLSTSIGLVASVTTQTSAAASLTTQLRLVTQLIANSSILATLSTVQVAPSTFAPGRVAMIREAARVATIREGARIAIIRGSS